MLREFSRHVPLHELLALTLLPEQPFLCVENSSEKHIRSVTEDQMAQTVPTVLQQQLKLKALARR